VSTPDPWRGFEARPVARGLLARFGWTNWAYLVLSGLAYLLAASGGGATGGLDRATFGKQVMLLWLIATAAFVVLNLLTLILVLVRRRMAWRALIGVALPFGLVALVGFLQAIF